MSGNWCECREYLSGTLHKCKIASETKGVHCAKTPLCVFVHGHGGDCRIPQPGDGDLSDEIRMRVLRDRAITEYERGLEDQKKADLAACGYVADLYGEDSERGLAAEDIKRRILNPKETA